MIALLDVAIEAVTQKPYLSRKDVTRLLNALYELAAFIEKRYYHVLRDEDDGPEDWEQSNEQF